MCARSRPLSREQGEDTVCPILGRVIGQTMELIGDILLGALDSSRPESGLNLCFAQRLHDRSAPLAGHRMPSLFVIRSNLSFVQRIVCPPELSSCLPASHKVFKTSISSATALLMRLSISLSLAFGSRVFLV